VAAALRLAFQSPNLRQEATNLNLAAARERLDQRHNLSLIARRFEDVIARTS
jgi:hypothetical protein